jgi:hypothetical protein
VRWRRLSWVEDGSFFLKIFYFYYIHFGFFSGLTCGTMSTSAYGLCMVPPHRWQVDPAIRFTVNLLLVGHLPELQKSTAGPVDLRYDFFLIHLAN